MEIIGHVVTLALHVCTHLVERGSGNEVTLAVDLPSDGGVLGANRVVPGCARGGSSVVGHVCTIITVNDHTTHQVRIEKLLIVDDSENLSLHTHPSRQIC